MISETIDLHGMRREEAFLYVEDELLRRSNLGSFSITIITGNSKAMRDGVIKVCDKHGFDYVVPSYNMGQLSVTYLSI